MTMRRKMRRVAAGATIAIATALTLAVAPAPAWALQCDGPPAGTPAQERACAEAGTHTWDGDQMVFGKYLCTRRDNGTVDRWAQWSYQDSKPGSGTKDFYVGGSADCRLEDFNPWIVNRKLKCINSCDSDAVQITVESFTFDNTNKQTIMHLLLEPQRNAADCEFPGFTFQDAKKETYNPGGDLKHGNLFFWPGGKPAKLTVIYSFLPSRGSTYTLQPLDISCQNEWGPLYGDAQFTFP